VDAQIGEGRGGGDDAAFSVKKGGWGKREGGGEGDEWIGSMILNFLVFVITCHR